MVNTEDVVFLGAARCEKGFTGKARLFASVCVCLCVCVCVCVWALVTGAFPGSALTIRTEEDVLMN